MNIQGPNQKNSGNQRKESNKIQCVSVFKFTPNKRSSWNFKNSSSQTLNKNLRTSHHPEKAEVFTKYIYIHTLALAQDMSSDFSTVTEHCNKRVAIRHYLRSEESHDLYPRILEELRSLRSDVFLKVITTIG